MPKIGFSFSQLVEKIISHPGIADKRPISNILSIFGGMNQLSGMGDDCGYLSMEDGDGHLLLTADSIKDWLLEDPYFAGFCGINVVVNDIFAMGGIPLALVDTVHAAGDGEGREWLNSLAQGMNDACRKFGVPLLGGHLTPDAACRVLSVSGVGRAGGTMLTTFGARMGDSVIAAYDLSGGLHSPFPIWDSSTAAEPEVLQGKLNLLVQIAENSMATAARDISNAGIIGTLAMLAEASGVAAEVDLEKIPHPPDTKLQEWIFTYPSYGFILTTPPPTTKGVVDLFKQQGIAAAKVGTIAEGSGVTIKYGSEESTIFRSGIIGEVK